MAGLSEIGDSYGRRELLDLEHESTVPQLRRPPSIYFRQLERKVSSGDLLSGISIMSVGALSLLPRLIYHVISTKL